MIFFADLKNFTNGGGSSRFIAVLQSFKSDSREILRKVGAKSEILELQDKFISFQNSDSSEQGQEESAAKNSYSLSNSLLGIIESMLEDTREGGRSPL
jgi:hypothetical protein